MEEEKDESFNTKDWYRDREFKKWLDWFDQKFDKLPFLVDRNLGLRHKREDRNKT